MSAEVEAIIDLVLDDEGGIGDAHDGKGITRFGQTPTWLEDNGFLPPNTPEEAAANYRVWMARNRLDQLAEVDLTIGHLVTDDAVHANVGDAVRRLQTALVGVTVDGRIGPLTLEAVRRAHVSRLAKAVLAAKMENRGKLLGSMKTDRRKFAENWLHRLAKQVRTLP
jgi:lysozyme family protein